jgi:hypothetical protein
MLVFSLGNDKRSGAFSKVKKRNVWGDSTTAIFMQYHVALG